MAEKKATPKKETMAAEAKAAEVKTKPRAETIWEKLHYIQQNIVAPKGQYNDFGKYKYRSLEDIQNALKPHLAKTGCNFILSDEIVLVGDRYYIRATATLRDIITGDVAEVTAYAREAETQRGMDTSQITGTASSYARKYAANGLLAIDDTKDADTNEWENQGRQNKPPARANAQPETVTCPKCNGEVKAARGRSGAVLSAQQVLEELGSCSDCFRATQENKPDVMTGRELAEQQAAQNG